MKTNFFERIAGLQIQGNLQISIQAHEGCTLTVSVLLANTNPKITAGENIPPTYLQHITGFRTGDGIHSLFFNLNAELLPSVKARLSSI